MPTKTQSFEGLFQPEQEKTFAYVPFEMPSDAIRIQGHLDYTNRIHSNPLLTGGNTLDLGVFDSRGTDFLTAGFRGWSGSERLSFFIGETEATPGYLAGPLLPGQWNVYLGLYKIAPEGCSWRVTVTIETGAKVASTNTLTAVTGELPSSAPRAPFAPWLRGEVHCHTWHSDGDRSAADVVALARARDLDFLAITDHNTIASQRELAGLIEPGIVLIRGVEATTFKGHFNVWGIPDWVDFRVQTPAEMTAALGFAHERGALTCCNHPKPYGPAWDYHQVTNYDCIEVWNGPWTLLNEMALELWKDQLGAGRHIPAVGGSDWHRQSELAEGPPRAPGTPTVWVYARGEPSAASILQGMRQGHVSLSSEPEGAFLDVRAGTDRGVMGGDTIARPSDGRLAVEVRCQRGKGHVLQLLDQTGVLFSQIVAETDESVTAELPVPASLYVRAELRTAEEEMKAMTNPIYLDKG